MAQNWPSLEKALPGELSQNVSATKNVPSAISHLAYQMAEFNMHCIQTQP